MPALNAIQGRDKALVIDLLRPRVVQLLQMIPVLFDQLLVDF